MVGLQSVVGHITCVRACFRASWLGGRVYTVADADSAGACTDTLAAVDLSSTEPDACIEGKSAFQHHPSPSAMQARRCDASYHRNLAAGVSDKFAWCGSR